MSTLGRNTGSGNADHAREQDEPSRSCGKMDLPDHFLKERYNFDITINCVQRGIDIVQRYVLKYDQNEAFSILGRRMSDLSPDVVLLHFQMIMENKMK